jgi:hypothetical protein
LRTTWEISFHIEVCKDNNKGIPSAVIRAISSAAAGAITVTINTTSSNPRPKYHWKHAPDVLTYPTNPTFQSQSMNTTDDEETTTLSEETILKIEGLKRLIYRYSQYHRNPGAVINWIVYHCNNGDNTLLDVKLEQLRSIDVISNYFRPCRRQKIRVY